MSDLDDFCNRFEAPLEARGLEWLLTSPLGFGIVTATPVQRAACRIREGTPLGELGEHPDVVQAFGGREAVRLLPSERGLRPIEICEVASPRTAKTIRACASALMATQTVDVSRLGPGEIPRVSVVSLKLDVAQVPFRILTGTVERSPFLRRLLISKTQTTALFRHPTGKEIEVACVAGAKAGAGLIARWSAGVIFDEAPRMQGQEDGIVNLDDARSAVLDRLLPGAQIQYIGSPWAPSGPVYRMVQESHGHPTAELVVFRTTGPAGNPYHWTAELCDRLKRQDINAWTVGVLCDFVDAVMQMFGTGEIEACATLAEPQKPNPLWSYVALIDPATRRNAWTLVVIANAGDRLVVSFWKEWVPAPTAPLKPEDILREIAGCIRPYGLDTLHSDQWSADALKDLARLCGLVLLTHDVTSAEKVDFFDSLGVRLKQKSIELPADPTFVRDLKNVRKRVTRNGMSIELLQTSDGRHADYAAALGLGMKRPIADPKPDVRKAAPGDYAKKRKAELSALIRKKNNSKILRIG